MKRSIIYTAIKEQAQEKLQDLLYIDLQKGQFKKPESNYPIPLPALLVELKDARYTDILNLEQTGSLELSLYLYLDLVTDSFDGAKLEEETLQILDKMDEIYQIFHGLSTAGFSKLIRTREALVEYGKNYLCFRTDFTTSTRDAKDTRTLKIARPSITIDTND